MEEGRRKWTLPFCVVFGWIRENAVASAELGDLKVLIVEDNLHFRNLVESILRALGVPSIEEAQDGSEAIEVLDSYPVDLAILDWKMDGVDGIECVRRIRMGGRNWNRFLPMIMVTGYTEPGLMREARDAGVDELLSKPISAKSLLSRIKTVMGNRRQFIDIEGYFGPDRRRSLREFSGPNRRRVQTPFVPCSGNGWARV